MSFSLQGYVDAFQKDFDGNQRITKETYQVFIAIIASLCFLAHGFVVTQSELLLTSESFLTIGQVGKSENILKEHLHTVFFGGELLGALVSFIFADEFGRKTTLVCGCLIAALCSIWYAVADSGMNLLTARFFVGSCFGVLLTVCPVYIAEIATVPSRGQCVGYLALNMVCGSLVAVLLFYCSQNNRAGWRLSLILPIVLLVLEGVVLYFLPASPRWMLAQKTPAKCLKALCQLRRTSDVGREFNEVYRALTSDAKLGHDWQDLLQTRSILVRLVLSAVLGASHVFVGMQLISIFGHQLFSGFGDESVVLGLLLVLLAELLGTGVFLLNIDTVGRRVLLMSGCALMGLAWLIAAICVYIATSPQLLHLSQLEDAHSRAITLYAVYATQFLFGCALCVYSFSFALSIGSVFWVYCSEIFPYRTRAKAATVTMCSYFLGSMCNSSLYHLSLAGVGIWGTFHSDTGGEDEPVDEAFKHHHHHRHSSASSDSMHGSVYDGLYNIIYRTLYNEPRNVHARSLTTVEYSLHSTTPTYIVDDDRATLFILHLAVVSLLLGLFVYLFVPETKELRLEVMDELFRLDHSVAHPAVTNSAGTVHYGTSGGTNTAAGNNMLCGSCNELRTLGLRTLSEQQRGQNRSASKPHAPLHADYSTFQQRYIDSINSASGGAEDDEIIPSSLHKYSAEMRGSKFSYIEEDEPLVPSFNLNF